MIFIRISSHYNCSFNGGSSFWHDRKVGWKPCFSEAVSQNYLGGWLPGYCPHFGSDKTLFYFFYRLFIDYFCGQLRGADPPPLSWDPATPMLPQSPSSLTFKHILPHGSEHEKPPFTARPPSFLPQLRSPSQMHCERGVSSHSPSVHLVTLRFGFHSYFSIKMAFTKFPRTSSNQ